MKNKILIITFLAVFAICASGCSSGVFNRKFVRKKKQAEETPKVYHVEPFVKPPCEDIYKHAFLLWKTWESELLKSMSPSGYPRAVNMRKVKDCLSSAISNLNDMKGCLNDKKAKELDVYLKQLQGYFAAIEKGALSDSALSRMQQDIESHKRNIDIRFCYSRIKDDIKDDSSRPESD